MMRAVAPRKSTWASLVLVEVGLVMEAVPVWYLRWGELEKNGNEEDCNGAERILSHKYPPLSDRVRQDTYLFAHSRWRIRQ